MARKTKERNRYLLKAFCSQGLSYFFNTKGIPVLLKQISCATGLSETYLSRVFKAIIGIPFREISKRSKLFKAFLLILYTDIPFERVAKECGYSSTNNFNRSFKKAFGIHMIDLRNHRFSKKGLIFGGAVQV